MDESGNPEAGARRSHVKFEQGKSLGWSIDTSSSESRDGSFGTLPSWGKPQTKEMETEKMESESESRSEEEEREREALLDRIKMETPNPKDRPNLQVTCAC